jgi:hypothetical protein
MFFASAVTKIKNTGITWGLHALTDIFYKIRVRTSPGQQRTLDFFLDHFPMPLLGTGVLLLELAAPLALLRGIPRVIILPLLVMMQLGIHTTMGLDFRPTFALIPFFVPWSRLRRVLSEKVRSVYSRAIAMLQAKYPNKRVSIPLWNRSSAIAGHEAEALRSEKPRRAGRHA